MKTWLIIAAEAQEFAGVLRRAPARRNLPLPGVAFAREIAWNHQRWILLANGPGPGLVKRALQSVAASGLTADAVMSTGFCGALDPALRVGDIVISGDCMVQTRMPYVRGAVWSMDRVVVTSGEKRRLHEETSAAVVEMESAAVAEYAGHRGLPFHCVRVVSDDAGHDMPLDFNLFRDAEGRFSRSRIALAGIARPFTAIPALLRLDANCRQAAEKLGEFLANCEY